MLLPFGWLVVAGLGLLGARSGGAMPTTPARRQQPQGLSGEQAALVDAYLADAAAGPAGQSAARARYEYLLEVDQRVDWCLHRPLDWGGGIWWPDSFYEQYFRCIYVLKGYGGQGQEDWWVTEERKKEEDAYLAHLQRIEDSKALVRDIAARLENRTQ